MKNFNDVIQNLIETNEKLLKGEIEIEVAKAISQNTQVLINAAKVSIEIAKFTDKKFNYFLDNESIDDTLKKIELENKKPYEIGK